MQEARNVLSKSGDAELREVAKRCVSSPEKHLFVVGPSQSGKSTRLPMFLAASSGKRVIIAQPDDWVARYHAEWVQESAAAGTYSGQKRSVGYYADLTETPIDFVPDYEVNYVSYRWLYRMVVGINTPAPSTGLDNEYTRAKAAEAKEALNAKREKYGQLIGHVILDDFHAQSVTQELGYLAVHAATLGFVQPPIGFFEGTKFILMTAYPENCTFLNCFGLSENQIKQQTITITTGLAPAAHDRIEEIFMSESEEDGKLQEYHSIAVRKAREILKTNANARVLLFMDTTYSARNIARQAHLPTLDLETESGRNQMRMSLDRQVVILATPSFASRIPIRRITDVICPSTQRLPVVDRQIHREVLVDTHLAEWELTWAKNHLDRTCICPTIHYMFGSSKYPNNVKVSGARWFHHGDFVDILLGLIRLCPKNAMCDVPTPMRFEIPITEGGRAFNRLTLMPEMVGPGPHALHEMVPYYRLSDTHRIQPMLKLGDCCGLDRRQAFFLGQLEDLAVAHGVKATKQRFVSMVAVAMVVFGETPILRRKGPPRSNENVTGVFPNLQSLLHLGLYEDFTSDSWVNAVVWMDIKRRADAARVDIAVFAQENHRSKKLLVDKVPLQAAESKLRLLARMVDLDETLQDALCNGSFLVEVEKFNNTANEAAQMAVELLWTAYLDAYRYNLAYVQMEKNNAKTTAKINDISSGLGIDYAWKHVAIDLFEQARIGERSLRDGFYAIGSVLKGSRWLRNLTVMPVNIVCTITEDRDSYEGAWNLHTHLNLD
ncbi:hypothetical protein E0Z10_g3979 [Xylaria hypoxylon]|uniref:Uncharacterized protein n=1 Tax=Xylaria hypoxylon TaxID=37992 RepID=A0A4Z0YZ75_9PEZI|nr:hypothetical protein E0Z10_g3979 [Xylaria hypoxylon]